jgi:hypothetical protein
MKGTILGFTPSTGTGAISGENGDRYSFDAAQWRGDRPVSAGVAVDFAPSDGMATEIYPVLTTVGGTPDLSALTSSPAIQRVKQLTFGTLAFPLAILLLLATLLPAINMPAPWGGSSLWGIGRIVKIMDSNPILSKGDPSSFAEEIDNIDKEITDLRQPRSDPTGMGAILFNPTDVKNRIEELEKQKQLMKDAAVDARWANTIENLLIIRFLVPVMAIVLIWLAWTDKALAPAALVTGGISILVFLLIYMFRNSLAGTPDEDSLGGVMSKNIDAMISLGFGTYLILLCGIGLVLAGLGFKNPLTARNSQAPA